MDFAVLVFAFLSFTVSASAGLGGSLILVPALAMVLGPKNGIAMASALLAMNNVGKVIAYRKNVPLRASAAIVVATIIGALCGSLVLVRAPESWVGAAVVVFILSTFVHERFGPERVRGYAAAPLALLAGGTSGFSGTSGPLKGIAIRSLSLQRERQVGAASVVSLAGDTSKMLVFSTASMYQHESLQLAVAAIPLILCAVLLGRHLNQAIGERGYAILFWCVMIGYSVRIFRICF